ncbi:hypothetical protein B0H11DRAFT_2263897 [Mycena galericulata]|nr:hypothetical protein B0H11DRAFT_2263897 [Mycena galericulata]
MAVYSLVTSSWSPPTADELSEMMARGWVKKSLAILFGGPEAKAKLTTRISKREIDAEAELMEALADAEEDEQPDDGAVEGPSEDEYEP